MTATEYFVVAGLALDIVGFAVVTRYGFSFNVFAGRLDDVIAGLHPATPVELEEERLENQRIKRQRSIAKWGIGLIQLGFLSHLVGVVAF